MPTFASFIYLSLFSMLFSCSMTEPAAPKAPAYVPPAPVTPVPVPVPEPTPVPKPDPNQSTAIFLSLGDSYTIGESVPEADRWSVQLVDMLQSAGIQLSKPDIIARTGWTTA